MKMSLEIYRDKLRAAMLGRFAGCTLGAPVEGWSMERMEAYAGQLGVTYPLQDYWPNIPNPSDVRYLYSRFEDYTKPRLCAVPCDDDVNFTILSLLIAEEGHGKDFTLDDVGNAWLKYITLAYTAEEVALKNLKNGVPPEKAAEVDNPYAEWIGADIRCDGYGYLAPGDPQKAAEMARTDAYISHRGNGIYGSMYFAAVIAIAFEEADVLHALREGLKYIPLDCELSQGLRWALEADVRDYRHAAELVDARYPGMHPVHTINNACLTVFTLRLGGKDIGKVIANAVAMAHDNDCTAATAGSVAGACLGMKALDPKWYEPFQGRVLSFYNGPREYSIEDLLRRYEKMALS